MQYMRLIVCAWIAAMVVISAAMGQVPDSDIWLADLVVSADSVAVGAPRNATHRPGYDNQPCFLREGNAFLFVSADSAGQTDVFRFDVESGAIRRVTATPESEYSPTPLIPPRDGFCTVRVEADSTQRLWRFDMDGTHPKLVLADVDSVGYFAWIDEHSLALFVVGKPHTLRVVDVATQHEVVVARDVGRSILLAPEKHGTSFLRREVDDTYAFFLLPRGAGDPMPLIDAVGKSQDAAWIGETLMMASGAKVFAAHPFKGPGWREVADLAGSGIAAITRIAVSPDHRRVALVATASNP